MYVCLYNISEDSCGGLEITIHCLSESYHLSISFYSQIYLELPRYSMIFSHLELSKVMGVSLTSSNRLWLQNPQPVLGPKFRRPGQLVHLGTDKPSVTTTPRSKICTSRMSCDCYSQKERINVCMYLYIYIYILI